MNKIIAFAIKMSGGGWVWDKVNGLKTKIASAGLMLSGASMMLAGVSDILMCVNACPNMAGLVELARSLSANPNVKTAMEGFVVFNAGLAGLGIGHKLEKQNEVAPVAPPPVV